MVSEVYVIATFPQEEIGDVSAQGNEGIADGQELGDARIGGGVAPYAGGCACAALPIQIAVGAVVGYVVIGLVGVDMVEALEDGGGGEGDGEGGGRGDVDEVATAGYEVHALREFAVVAEGWGAVDAVGEGDIGLFHRWWGRELKRGEKEGWEGGGRHGADAPSTVVEAGVIRRGVAGGWRISR